MGMDQRIADIIQSTAGRLAGMPSAFAASLRAGTSMPGVVRPAGSDNLIVIYCHAQATASVRQGIDGREQLVFQGRLQDSAGTDIGGFRAVYQAKIFSKSDLFAYPEPPSGPFDRPYGAGEPEWNPELNPTKSEWTFDQMGQVVSGVGLGLCRIAVEPYAGIKFWYSTNSFLFGHANGNAVPIGEAASLGTATFAGVPALSDGMSFTAEIFHLLTLTPSGG